MLFTPRQKGLGKENFLTLNDKEEVTGIFSGEIFTYKRHWSNNRSQECIGQDCPFCKAEPDKYPAFRFRINFITTKDGKWVSKIFEGGGETYDQLASLDRKFDLSKTIVEITRRGLKQNTKYDILPLTNQPITKEMETKIKGVTLLPLSFQKNDE
jgi:hypothetical protein